MKIFGLIGKPIHHSPAPKIFNAVFKKLNLAHRYLPFQVEKEHLKNLILCMKLVDVHGLNVTIPYKESVLPFLDSLDVSAKQSGAVNTIVRRKNKFIGYNTDGIGFVEALREQKNFNPRGKNIVILGAGGAARGIAAALAKAGASTISILNRHPVRAKKAASFLKKQFPKTIFHGFGLNQKGQRDLFAKADLLVQATSAHLTVPLEHLPKKALVCDIVYKPLQTKLLNQAQKLKLPTLDGLWMLVFQAKWNLKLWTGADVDATWLRRKCQ